ncbi:MAG: glycoside hydrolase family 3 C-terminal domain-containing protein, partial [Clostridia bacterium]
KNEDNILPLQLDKKYLVVGAMAQKMRYQSTGSSHINTAQTPSILDVFQLNNISYEYAQGYDEDADNINVKLEAEAVSKAQNADYVLFFGGLTDAFEGEFADRKTMDMPTNQVQLLNRLRAVNENIVFVFFAGSPVAMPWISNVKALLNMYLGGQAVGESCYDLLFGKDNPSGKLAETFPVHYEDTPSFNYFANRLRAISMRESIFVGYR